MRACVRTRIICAAVALVPGLNLPPNDIVADRVSLSKRLRVTGWLHHICKDSREVIVDSQMQLLGDDTVLEVNRDITRARTPNIQPRTMGAACAT